MPSSLCLLWAGVEVLSRVWGTIFADVNVPEFEPTPSGNSSTVMVAEANDPSNKKIHSVQHHCSSGSIQLPGRLIPDIFELASHNTAVVVNNAILCHLAIWLETVSCPLALMSAQHSSVTLVTITIVATLQCLNIDQNFNNGSSFADNVPVSLTMVFDMLSQTMLPAGWQQS